jgi:hypothetical protein
VSSGTARSSEPILPRSGGSGGVKVNDMRTGRQIAADGTTMLLDIAEESFDTAGEQIVDADEREVSSPSHPLEKLPPKGVTGDNSSHPLATLDRQDLRMDVEVPGNFALPTPPPTRMEPDLLEVSRQSNLNVSGLRPETVGMQPLFKY